MYIIILLILDYLFKKNKIFHYVAIASIVLVSGSRYATGYDFFNYYTFYSVHLFDSPFQSNDPYLRVLLDYGQLGQAETETLIRVQERLPTGSIAELDDQK